MTSDRLENRSTKPVLTAPPKTVTIDKEKVRLNADQYQEYQRISGEFILQTMQEVMQTPEWAEYTDAEKIKTIKKVTKDMRAYAREDLGLINSTEEDE